MSTIDTANVVLDVILVDGCENSSGRDFLAKQIRFETGGKTELAVLKPPILQGRWG